MVSNNVWVEATVHPDSAANIQTYIGNRSNLRLPEPLDKLHITMAFTTLKAEELDDFDELSKLRNRLGQAVIDLPDVAEGDGFKINGAAILAPGKGDYGVLLVSSQILWSYHTAFAREMTKDNMLDLTYPGWLPHITLAYNVDNSQELETIHRAATVGSVKLDGLWLRAGRTCVPL